MPALFGTDGVRGIPGTPPLTADMVRRLAYSAARAFLERSPRRNGCAPEVLVGRDTRDSGPALEACLAQGFARAGCRVTGLGVVPTPAVSYLAPRRGALAGVVVSASHNPPEFNGIKFFTGDGFKASPELEEEIERRMESCLGLFPSRPAAVRLLDGSREADDYLDFLRSTVPATRDFSGLRIVLDAGHGAAHRVAPALLRGLGAEVFCLGCAPDGSNINSGCGALDTGAMRREVLRRRAHCGISLDGDADRALVADEKGRLLDGDALIAMSALYLRGRGLLRRDGVVVTVMSNLGMIRFLEGRGIAVVQVPVGDRNVTQAIEKGGYRLGGENSGHIVYRSFSPTGDGVLTGLQTLAAMLDSGRPMSHFRSLYRSYPQVLRNVRVERRVPLEKLPGLQRRLREADRRLAGSGRVFVRYSGTEPLVRILVEGPDDGLVRSISDRLARAFHEEVHAK